MHHVLYETSKLFKNLTWREFATLCRKSGLSSSQGEQADSSSSAGSSKYNDESDPRQRAQQLAQLLWIQASYYPLHSPTVADRTELVRESQADVQKAIEAWGKEDEAEGPLPADMAIFQGAQRIIQGGAWGCARVRAFLKGQQVAQGAQGIGVCPLIFCPCLSFQDKTALRPSTSCNQNLQLGKLSYMRAASCPRIRPACGPGKRLLGALGTRAIPKPQSGSTDNQEEDGVSEVAAWLQEGLRDADVAALLAIRSRCGGMLGLVMYSPRATQTIQYLFTRRGTLQAAQKAVAFGMWVRGVRTVRKYVRDAPLNEVAGLSMVGLHVKTLLKKAKKARMRGRQADITALKLYCALNAGTATCPTSMQSACFGSMLLSGCPNPCWSYAGHTGRGG
eukprot:1155317-Pelagomonas_calceolata.AAC.2